MPTAARGSGEGSLRTRRTLRRRAPLLALIAAASLIAACSSGGGDDAGAGSDGPTSGPSSTTSTTAPPPVAPLTGLVTTADVVGLPALVVKIDNADGGGRSTARPQAGLNQADVVYEELVEGSVTRLAAVFHSTPSDPVGPIRSGRLTDIEVFSALNHPLFAWSGGNANVTSAIRSSPIIDVGYDTNAGAYFRSSDYVAPHNLFSSTAELYALTPPEARPPAPLFSFRSPGEAGSPTAVPVGSVHVTFGSIAGSAPVDWSWDPSVGLFTRVQKGTPHLDASGAQVGTHNVIVQFTEYAPNGDRDSAGNPVVQGELVGTGTCWVLTAGTRTDCSWSKASAEAPTQYLDAAGAVIKLTPGRTWVELAPPGLSEITG